MKIVRIIIIIKGNFDSIRLFDRLSQFTDIQGKSKYFYTKVFVIKIPKLLFLPYIHLLLKNNLFLLSHAKNVYFSSQNLPWITNTFVKFIWRCISLRWIIYFKCVVLLHSIQFLHLLLFTCITSKAMTCACDPMRAITFDRFPR